jgi:GWxTD domain-containing protein
MRKKMHRSATFVTLTLLLIISAVASVALPEKVKLPVRYQQWLEEEVVYIIAPLEREVFLKLTTDRERDLFMEAFWKHRDPTLSTPENEFKSEHYRRIQYANHFFGRQAPRPGWKTDRGRIYIILGEPNDIQRFEGKTQTYPAEIWFYQDKSQFGLPPGFHIVFFQPGGVGEYRLYSPAVDGPQALMTSYEGDPVDYSSAYLKLKEIEPTLADVSLSLVPGEETALYGRPSLSSDLLIQRVETTPQRMVEEKYARKFLEYKDTVEVEYTANYMDSDALVKLARDPGGLYFVHFLLEPARLSLGQFEKKYYTTLKLNGIVSTLEGKPVYQFDRAISLDFDEEKMAAASRQPLNIHDMFPLVPGSYRFSLLLKNEVSKEFTSLETELRVPGDDAGLQLTSPVLGYKSTRPEGNTGNLKPFRFGGRQVYCQPNRVFLPKDTLTLALQIHGLPPEAKDSAEVRYVFSKEDAAFRTFSKKIAEFAELPDLIQEFPLVDFPPAHYTLQVSLLAGGREAASVREEFDITHREFISRPWVYSKLLPPSTDPVYDYLVGNQYLNLGELDQALPRLERACRMRPESADFAQSLAQAYLMKDEFLKVEPLLRPFFGQDKPARYEFYLLQGRAFQKAGDWDKGISFLDEAIAHYGVNAAVLNGVAACYLGKGDEKAALTAWEKSLGLNPDQPEVRRAVEALKGKK